MSHEHGLRAAQMRVRRHRGIAGTLSLRDHRLDDRNDRALFGTISAATAVGLVAAISAFGADFKASVSFGAPAAYAQEAIPAMKWRSQPARGRETS